MIAMIDDLTGKAYRLESWDEMLNFRLTINVPGEGQVELDTVDAQALIDYLAQGEIGESDEGVPVEMAEEPPTPKRVVRKETKLKESEEVPQIKITNNESTMLTDEELKERERRVRESSNVDGIVIDRRY